MLKMKNFAFAGIFVYLITGILMVGGGWSYITSISPAVSPDSTSTPNPMGTRK